MNGPGSSQRAKRGRPRKKPEYDREQNIQDLLNRAVELFGIPYDDRDERPPDAPSISYVAEQLNTSRMRVRKLLITAEVFSTELSRRIQELHNEGHSVQEISKIMGLGRAAVHSYLPYEKGIYKMDELSVNAEQCRQFQQRRRACEQLKEHLDEDCCDRYLWEAIKAFEEYTFRTRDNCKLRYSIDCERISFGDLTLCRNEIEKAYRKARQIQNVSGCVCDAARLSCKGAKELYTIFLRIGACCKSVQNF